jgi:hypothetical protein
MNANYFNWYGRRVEMFIERNDPTLKDRETFHTMIIEPAVAQLLRDWNPPDGPGPFFLELKMRTLSESECDQLAEEKLCGED